MGRTTVVVNDKLMDEAIKVVGAKTKRGLWRKDSGN